MRQERRRLLADVFALVGLHCRELPNVGVGHVGCHAERTPEVFVLTPEVFVLTPEVFVLTPEVAAALVQQSPHSFVVLWRRQTPLALTEIMARRHAAGRRTEPTSDVGSNLAILRQHPSSLELTAEVSPQWFKNKSPQLVALLPIASFTQRSIVGTEMLGKENRLPLRKIPAECADVTAISN